MSVAFTLLLAANSDLTFVVIQASSALPATVWLSPFDMAAAESCAYT